MKASVLKIEAFFFFLIGIVFNLSTQAQINSCNLLNPIELAQSQKPNQTSSIAEWAKYQSQIFEAKKQTSREIFKSYMSETLDPQFFENCFKSKEQYNQLQEVLPNIFLEESLRILGTSRSPSLIKLSEQLNSRIKNNNFIIFRLAGHFKEDPAPTPLAGGFHRATGSIFMNFTKIPANEWLIIFIHEIMHSLDHNLSNAISEYSNNVASIQMAKDKKLYEQLSHAQKTELQRWLKAGLDRGFLAEFRAWLITFKIYQEGLNERFWQPVDWLDSILNLKQDSENLADFTFRYLDPRFLNPDEWPFSVSPAKEALENLRQQLRQSETNKLELLNLENLIQ